MKLVKFPEVNLVIAKDQPEYIPMPANYEPEHGVATICWQLTFRERARLLFAGKLWHQIMTFGAAMQPQRMSATKPELKL